MARKAVEKVAKGLCVNQEELEAMRAAEAEETRASHSSDPMPTRNR